MCILADVNALSNVTLAMLHAMTLHLLWVLKFRVYSNTPALDLFSNLVISNSTAWW